MPSATQTLLRQRALLPIPFHRPRGRLIPCSAGLIQSRPQRSECRLQPRVVACPSAPKYSHPPVPVPSATADSLSVPIEPDDFPLHPPSHPLAAALDCGHEVGRSERNHELRCVEWSVCGKL